MCVEYKRKYNDDPDVPSIRHCNLHSSKNIFKNSLRYGIKTKSFESSIFDLSEQPPFTAIEVDLVIVASNYIHKNSEKWGYLGQIWTQHKNPEKKN